ncbi:MAG: GNAT family N-acetyltransferase [Ginsengibacter sp.]
MEPIRIVDYQPKYQEYFEKFNRGWIERYFAMEAVDEYVLTNPEEAILKPGGAILIALYNETVAGVAGLRKVNDTVYEFTKMAVDEGFRRKGIAEALCQASFKKAKELGAEDVILYSNSILTPAIHLYEKLGFRHLPVGNAEYQRSDIKMTIPILQTETVNL